MTDSDVVIRVEGLGKRYALHHEQPERCRSLRDSMARRGKAASRWLNPFTLGGQLARARRQAATEKQGSEEEFWALKDVSFEVRRGERLGIIGRNGAGKSTLLKILSRITEPTTGRVEIRGRVASLLEVGTGFHPELTGRENIDLNGAILGMTRREIRAKFDEIVAFAEVEKFLDTPVKRYSSGMYVRLAFAVAAHLEPEILVVDEVLAVGDASFQKKCLGKMEDVANSENRTVIFVSHNMKSVAELCPLSIVLEDGKKTVSGDTDSCINTYLSGLRSKRKSYWERSYDSRGSISSNMLPSVAFTLIKCELSSEQPELVLSIDSRILVKSELSVYPFIAFDIADHLGQPLMQAITNRINVSSPSEIEIRTTIRLPPLIPGIYLVSAWIGTSNSATLDWVKEMLSIEILSSPLTMKGFAHSSNHGNISVTCRADVRISKGI